MEANLDGQIRKLGALETVNEKLLYSNELYVLLHRLVETLRCPDYRF